MDVLPKWIIEDDTLIIGKVCYHRELATDISKVKGGGWYHYNRAENAFYLYASSDQFGNATFDQVSSAVGKGNVGRFVGDDRYRSNNIYFSTSYTQENFTLIV